MKNFGLQRQLIILPLLILSFCLNLSGQTIQVPLDNKIATSNYIFEGEIINKKSFFDENDGLIYTSHTVRVSQLFKGNLKTDTVKIITLGGMTDELILETSNGIALQIGNEGIFFCNLSDYFSRDNSTFLTLYGQKQGFVRYDNIHGKLLAIGSNRIYQNIEKDLLSVIEKETNTRIKLNLNKREKWFLESIKNNSNLFTTKNGLKTGIEYEFTNSQVTGLNSNYLEFDIEVSAFGGQFLFGNSEIYFEYNPNAFGFNLVGNGKIIVNKETVILSSDYSLSVQNETNTMVKLLISCINNANAPFSLSTTKEKVCHLKLDISNLVATNPNIQFEELLMQNKSEYYHNGNFYDFIHVVANDIISTQWNSLLPPSIDSIYPEFMNTGIFDTLYIYGQNFDTIQGEVRFTDSELPFIATPSVKAEDIDVEWSDTLIKVMLFSRNLNNQTPGTGRISVTKANGQDTISTDNLLIGFAVRNYRDALTNQSIIPILVDKNNTDTFNFHLHHSISYASDTADVIRKTLKQWRCKSQLNWNLSTVPTSDNLGFNGMSTIKFVNNLDPLTLGETLFFATNFSNVTNECHYNNNKYIYIEEIDVYFNGNFDWFTTINSNLTDTTKSDLWTTSLHELGHVHLLKHNNFDYPSTMYTTRGEFEVYRTIDDFSKAGAIWITDSIEMLSPHCGGSIIKNLSGCISSTNGIQNQTAITVYPNPANQTIFLEKQNSEYFTQSNLTIYNGNGQIIQNIQNLNERLITIDIEYLSSGIYFILLRENDKTFTTTFIKY